MLKYIIIVNKGLIMIRNVFSTARYAGIVAVSLLPLRMQAVKEINTFSTPNILFSHAVSNVTTKEPLNFKGDTINALQSMTSDLTLLMLNFAVVCGFMVLLASLFQYFRYRENPHATRFTTVSTTFFCGIILIGVSYLAGTVTH